MKGKKIAVLTATSLLAFGLAACSKDKNEEVEVQEEKPVVQDKKPNIEDESKKQEEVKGPGMEEAKEIFTANAIFLGMKSNKVAEVQLGDERTTLNITEDANGVFNEVKADTNISFDYYEKDGEKYIVSLSINENPTVNSNNELNKKPVENVKVTDEVKKDKVEFAGIIDGHSAEFKKGEEYIVVEYGEGLGDALNAFDLEEMVTIEYKTNQYGQFVLTNVTK